MTRAQAIPNPLTLRLLRRILALSVLLILAVAGLRAWWEYRASLAATEQVLDDIEQTLGKPLTASLWDYDREQMAALVEGIASFQGVRYAALSDRGQVLAESGRRDPAAPLRDIPLQRAHDGRSLHVGTLLLQADLDGARARARTSALFGLAGNSGIIILVSLALFLLIRSMVSRHLAAAAEHFRALSLEAVQDGLPPLRLDRRQAGDELDLLEQAVNHMQEQLTRTYAQALAAEQEARSQARFPQENPNPVLRVDKLGVLTVANRASQDYLHHLDMAVGQHVPELLQTMVNAALGSGRVLHFEEEFGGRAYAFAARPVAQEGYVNLYGMDITERKAAEDAIREALREKDILLKEIHHRVKNNLQIISSLLFLQSEYVENPADRELFAESQKRIQAMALVHEELYGAEDLSLVNMREYLPRLVEQVLSGAPLPVRAEVEAEAIRLPVTRSIPCALVLNELVMNAVKHAFAPGRAAAAEGLLRVRLQARDGLVCLEVEDNGPGLPEGFDMEQVESLGLTLVLNLARQLGGEVAAVNLNPGAGFTLRFPVEAS